MLSDRGELTLLSPLNTRGARVSRADGPGSEVGRRARCPDVVTAQLPLNPCVIYLDRVPHVYRFENYIRQVLERASTSLNVCALLVSAFKVYGGCRTILTS